jgi:hypothetical protein
MDVVPELRTDPAMAICAETRCLRWTFRHDRDAVVCELGLNADASAYHLRLTPARNAHASTTEIFNDAMRAFQRHAVIERELAEQGWWLEGFESVIGATVANASLGG